MLITRKRSNTLEPPSLKLGMSEIVRTYSYKYLGITITSNLSWSQRHIMFKSKEAPWIIIQTILFKHKYNTSSLLKLYLSFIRPILEYSCQVWHPYLVKDIEKLECVQKFALRLCVKQWDLDYTNLLFICNLPTLAARRKYINLCIMYKIINNLMFFPHDQVFVPRVIPLQPAANFLFHQPFSHTSYFQHSFVPNTCHIWNSLPLTTRSADTLSTLKSSLMDILHTL